MSLSALANAENPIQAILEVAMKELGTDATSTTIQTYASLLDDAIRMDSGGEPAQWGEFLNDLNADNYFDAAVRTLAESIGASTSQAESFLRLTDAVIEIKSGVPEADALAMLEDELGSIAPTEPKLYAHLDDESRNYKLEFDEQMAEPNPDQPEPQPFIHDGDEDE